jgi:hypothetical protein
MKAYFLTMLIVILAVIVTIALGGCAHGTTYEYGHRYGEVQYAPTRDCVAQGYCKVVDVATKAFEGKGIITNNQLQEYADHTVLGARKAIPACSWNDTCMVGGN